MMPGSVSSVSHKANERNRRTDGLRRKLKMIFLQNLILLNGTSVYQSYDAKGLTRGILSSTTPIRVFSSTTVNSGIWEEQISVIHSTGDSLYPTSGSGSDKPTRTIESFINPITSATRPSQTIQGSRTRIPLKPSSCFLAE